MSQKVVVLGASPNPSRYSHRVIRKLIEYGYEVYPVGARSGNIETLDIIKEIPAHLENVYCVVLYLSAENQSGYYNAIINLKPEYVFFNPGTYNSEFENLLEKHQIRFVDGCTLAAISMDDF